MKKTLLLFLITFCGIILFSMSMSPGFNEYLITFVTSIPLIGEFIDNATNFIIVSWWQYIPFKPLVIVITTIVLVFLALGLHNTVARLKVIRSKTVAARKTMAHMVIKLDEIEDLNKNSGSHKIISADQLRLNTYKEKEEVKK